ncbi:TolC family protein, partial [Pelomonas sp. KK5]|uniref:TolC family protein n=1 Tax=Pelomonas sp. KK5 TaxID=1855730 RepID=UPI001301F842
MPVRAQAILTLEQALQQAVARHPSLAAAGREIEAAQAAAQQAAAWRNPELGTTLEDPARRDSRTSTVVLDIPIELGGKRGARIGAAERATALARAEGERTRAELRARVLAAFFGLRVAQERAALAADSAALARRAADAVQRRVDAGKASPVEATRARVDLANAELEGDEARVEQRTTRHALATLLGDAAPGFDTVAEDARLPPEPPAPGQLPALLEASPALLAARAETERRRALVEVERSKAAPDLTLSLGARHDAALGRSQAVIGLS